MFLLRVVRTTRHGHEVVWQGGYADIVTGRIPLDLRLPATAERVYDNVDQMVRVTFGPTDPEHPVEVDVWFDVQEEVIATDY